MSAAPRTNGAAPAAAGKRTLSLSMSAAETQAALAANPGGAGAGKDSGLHPLKHRCVARVVPWRSL